jgi:glycosyltransferase involved in cell wall biosynthesis
MARPVGSGRPHARVAWFSPLPPASTGVARCSADAIEALRTDHEIDVFVDEPIARAAPGTQSAHEFLWQHRRAPYDLTIFQLGNSSHHNYQWPYLFRYPGLTILHDAHLHHARAATLLATARADDYRAEFAWNHPDDSPDLAELAVAGFDSHLHYAWPMTRLVTQSSRLVAVHSQALADRLRDEKPGLTVEIIRLGHGRLVQDAEEAALSSGVRDRYGIAHDAILFGCFGGLTPEKRVPQILNAFVATRPYVPSAHLLLAGAPPHHDALSAEIRRLGLEGCATLTGYLEHDEEFTACIAACDVALTLRWPSAREMSGPWLRCMAAGKPTVIIDLAHLSDVPSLDPRTWQPNIPRHEAHDAHPVAVAIDILDEDHSLRLAMRRLAEDASLRAALGGAAREHWKTHHSIEAMAADYRRVIEAAIARPIPPAALPPHLLSEADQTLRELLTPFGLPNPLKTGPLR